MTKCANSWNASKRARASSTTTPFINPDVLRSLEQAAAAERTRTGASWKALFRAPYLSRSLVSWSMYSAGLITWYVVMVYVPPSLPPTGSSFPTQSS